MGAGLGDGLGLGVGLGDGLGLGDGGGSCVRSALSAAAVLRPTPRPRNPTIAAMARYFDGNMVRGAMHGPGRDSWRRYQRLAARAVQRLRLATA